jgi:hypothetical protein
VIGCRFTLRKNLAEFFHQRVVAAIDGAEPLTRKPGSIWHVFLFVQRFCLNHTRLSRPVKNAPFPAHIGLRRCTMVC